jgi:putative membrane protein
VIVTLAADIPQSTSEVLAFHLHLDVVGMVVALVAGYEYGIRRLGPLYAPKGEIVVTTAQRVAFYSGVFSLLFVSSWPIHDIGEGSLFIFHMIEHMAIGLVAPPLLLLGMPWWLLRLIVKPIMPVVKFLTRPLIALFAFNAMLGIIHIPAFVELMVTGPEWVHFVIHAILLITGLMMWWPVISPLPEFPQLSPFMKMGYLFLQSLVPTIPASFLTLGDSALYTVYEEFPRLWGLSAHSDQVIAGLIMKLGGGFLLWGFIAWVFFSWWNEEQRYGAADRPRVPEPT